MPRILYIQYTNPAGYPPLEHSSRILADVGWQVLFLGTGAHGANSLRFPPHANIAVRQIEFCPAGWRQKLHYLRYALWVLFWTIRWRPKWIYASNALVCPIARFLSHVPGLRVVYHEHDSPTPVPSPGVERTAESTNVSRFQRWILRSRKAVAQRARLCIIPNEARLRHFSTETGVNGRARCVWNCPSRSDVPAQLSRESGLKIWYHGSIVPSQFPEAVMHALTHLRPEVTLEFAGYETVGHPGYVQRLVDLARQLGIDDRVHYLGTLPDRGSLLARCSQCHVGVALFQQGTRQPMAGASNKPFDYLACGLALLVSELPEWRETYVVPGYGLACYPDDPNSIASALRWFLDHPEQTRAMGDMGRQRILDEWNYEKQFQPMCEMLNALYLPKQ